jgi:hypothetical protein
VANLIPAVRFSIARLPQGRFFIAAQHHKLELVFRPENFQDLQAQVARANQQQLSLAYRLAHRG